MTRSTCPADDELLRWIDGDPEGADLQGHLDGCPRCREHLAQLKAAAGVLRQFADEAPLCNGVGHDPVGRPGAVLVDTGATIPVDPRPSGGGGEIEDSSSESLPATIGKYPVVEMLGQGGQAVVYRGIHPGLRIDVAIKVSRRLLAAGRVDPHALKREAEALAKLNHPNLVRVYDLDVDAAGRLFLVMDSVRGPNLRQYAEQNRVEPRTASALVAAAARGAAAAHRKHLTHLDIKPENVLIDEAGRPRLIDFGLARLRNAWAEESSPSGGTLAFIAPEQARGEVVGNRGDIFALGGVLYFLLTGKAPFEGRDRGEMLDRARRCDFDRSALRAARVPRRLERICLRAMAAEAAGRYASADDLAADLEWFARPQRQPLAMSALAAILLMVVGVTVWLSIPKPEPRPTPPPSPPVKPLWITKMEIHHYRQNLRLGRIGVDSFAGRYQDDDVRVRAEFNAPAYCYLIALNPDGTVQFCPPGDEGKPPRTQTELTYPTGETVFGLTDGVGLQAFVLLASRRPLPSYREWKSRHGAAPWGTAPSAEGVWQFDGKSFEPLSQSRGQEHPLDCPKPFVVACRTLQGRPDIDAIRALAFPVVRSGEHPAPQPEPEPADRR
jgi:serine/threonine protein kinase